MSEEKIKKISGKLVEKQIELAKAKKDKTNPGKVVALEHEVINLRREINQELQKITNETV